MKKILSIAIVSAIALSACADKYKDGTRAPTPSTEMSEDGWNVLTSYNTPGSPVLDHWKNGLITVNCPAGHHFRIMNQRDADGQMAQCEPNEPPVAMMRIQPDPTRSADGRDG